MTSHPSSIMSLKRSSMRAWKVAGELQSPKNMTVGSKSPRSHLNAAFHWSPSFILTLLYPERKSSLEKTVAPLSLFMRFWTSGMGYEFLIVPSFR